MASGAHKRRVTRAGHGCVSRAHRRMRAHARAARSKPWSFHEEGGGDEGVEYDTEPAQERFGHVFQGDNGEEAGEDEPAAPLVLAPRHLYRSAHHSLDAMISALEAERDALLLLKNDGWEADAWNTEEFAALRPGGRSRWRVAGGGAAARRGGRSLLIRTRAAEGAAGSMEFADGPYEQH